MRRILSSLRYCSKVNPGSSISDRWAWVVTPSYSMNSVQAQNRICCLNIWKNVETSSVSWGFHIICLKLFSTIKILTDSCFLLSPSSFQIFCFMVHLEQERPPLFLLLPESFTGKSAQPFFILVVINFHHLAEFPLLHNKLRISEGEWKHVLPSDWEASTDVFILLM